jgi:hypothetical protein
MHKICFTISLFHASTCFEHHVLIVRRSKLYHTASGIITTVGGRPVHRLREERMCCHCLYHPHIHNSVTLKMGTARCSKMSDRTFVIYALRTQKTGSPATTAMKSCKLMLLQNWGRRKGLLPPTAEYISTPDIGNSLDRHVCSYWPECVLSVSRRPQSKVCPHECNLTVSQRNCCWRLVCGTHSCDRWINAFKVGNITWQHTT